MRHFEIQGSTSQPDKQWRLNITCHVVAYDAMRAMQLVLIKYPEIDIHSLQHKGKVDIIEEKENI